MSMNSNVGIDNRADAVEDDSMFLNVVYYFRIHLYKWPAIKSNSVLLCNLV